VERHPGLARLVPSQLLEAQAVGVQPGLELGAIVAAAASPKTTSSKTTRAGVASATAASGTTNMAHTTATSSGTPMPKPSLASRLRPIWNPQ
jgi:hypothetical protein